jgi:hypothetical protein
MSRKAQLGARVLLRMDSDSATVADRGGAGLLLSGECSTRDDREVRLTRGRRHRRRLRAARREGLNS